jgi:hypothetical protein
VLRDVRLADAKPDQPATDIGVKDGRIARLLQQRHQQSGKADRHREQ